MFLNDKVDLASKRIYTDEGYLKVPALISRAGLYNYTARELGVKDRNPNDVIIVYRSESEVFDEESLNSFKHKPVTNEHPSDGVNSKNYSKLAIGHSTSNVFKDDDGITAELIITDSKAIHDIKNGKVQMSNGYKCKISHISGMYEDQHYDAIQTGIRGNHIALVVSGRAGKDYKISDNLNEEQMTKNIKDEDTVKDKLNTSKIENRLVAIEDSLNSIKNTLEAPIKKIEDEAAKISDEDKFDAAVNAKVSVIKDAVKVMSNIDITGKSAIEIMKTVISDSKQNIDGKSDDYIHAVFDMLVGSAESKSKTSDDNSKIIGDSLNANGDAGVQKLLPIEIARNKLMEQNKKGRA